MDRRLAGIYFLIQGVVGLLWWVLLYASPTLRDWFVADAGWPVARSLVAADVVGFGLGSIAAGIAVLQQRPWTGAAVVAVAAVTAYATLVAATWVIDPVDRVLPVAAMTMAMAGTLAATQAVLRS